MERIKMEIEESGRNQGSLGCLIAFLLPFVLIGAGTFFFSVYNIILSQQSKNWDRTPAQIQNLELIFHSNEGTTSYKVNIVYEYVIENKKYQGSNIGFGYSMNNIDNHHKIYDKLLDVKKIMVYVNPKNNTESIIIPNINYSTIGLFIFSILWNSIVLFFVIKVFTPENSKITPNKMLPFLALIWIIGITLLVTRSFQIAIEDGIEIIEKLELNKTWEQKEIE